MSKLEAIFLTVAFVGAMVFAGLHTLYAAKNNKVEVQIEVKE